MNTCATGFRAFGCGLLIAMAGFHAAGPVRAGQIDTATFFLLETGMEESEVLVRAGTPDLVTSIGGEILETFDGTLTPEFVDGRGFGGVRRIHSTNLRRWHYIPDTSEHDPHLTVITMKSGRVSNIERKKVFSRQGLPNPKANSLSRRQVPSDDDIVRRRLERTLDAAERYARTRSRLKREEIALARAAADLPELTVGDTDAKVYRSVDDHGVVYYGDRPPNNPRPNVVDY
ncbi:MAG TPA: DUF4124 domain-containing protein [Gammaproteobacteria bacterium]